MTRGSPRLRPLILIADDEPIERFLHREALTPAGFDVIEAEDGAAALRLFVQRRPDLAVLDVIMPQMSGFDVCRAIRGLPEGRNAPLLIATGLDDVASIDEAFRAGATDFVGKPINWPALPHRIRYMLRAHETLASLAVSERRLAEAQRIAGLGHLRWQPHNVSVDCSPAVLRIFGLAGEGGSLSARALLRRIPRADRRNVIGAVRRALRGASIDLDHAVTTPDGSRRAVCLRAELSAAADGPGHLQGSYQDITERKRIEQELRSAHDEAQTASAAKTAFLAAMSHELRTPLNAILGFSEAIVAEALGPISPRKYGEFGHAIHDAGRQMLSVFVDVLTMAQLEAGRFRFEFDLIDLTEVARAAVAEFRETALGRNRTLEFAAAVTPAIVCADDAAVKQMVAKLLSNAARFSAGATPIEVQIARPDDRHLEVSVADRGIGMTAEEVQLAVRPFHQIDGRLERRYQGTGLGLSIVDKLITRHGGRLLIESAPQQGTCVRLAFPAAAPRRRIGDLAKMPSPPAMAAG